MTDALRPVLAYVGLGLMGGPMSRHLVSRGWTVRGFDVVPARVEAAAAHGVQPCENVHQAVEGVGLVLLNLPTTDAVEDAVFGPQGIAAVLAAPQRIVDFSTIEVERGRDFIARLQSQRGCGWVDAPVSGGPVAAGSGTLTVMAGATADDHAAVAPLMADVAARFTVLGPPGSGLVAKMLNQLMVGCLHATLAEFTALAESAGIEADRVPQALAGGHADGVLFQQIYPRMRARDFAPRGYVRQLLKDLDMVQAFAKGLQVPTPMTAQAQTLYRMLARAGHTELDTSAVLKLYDRENDPNGPLIRPPPYG
jgi:3-hydroxyisobutyrate dehydrogenase-like beta-hydroxyacid dehydrogenase